MNRRKFTKEFKEDAARRVELGAPVREVARACRISPNVLRRWRDELRDQGANAFSGNGQSRSSTNPKTQAVIFRLTRDEYESLKAATSAVGRRSLSDFVRWRILHAPAETSLKQVDEKLDELRNSVQRLAEMFANIGKP